MANKENAKQWFETGDYPTQVQFAQVFDWLRWKDEGISIADVANLQNFLNTIQATLNSLIPNMVISGGLVTIKSDDGTTVVLQIDATVYSIKGIAYNVPHSEVMVTRPTDNSLSRFDVFYLDATGFKVLKGVESAAPVKPQLQSGMELTTILVGFNNPLETQPMPGTPNLQQVTLAGNKTTTPLISKDSLQAGQAASDIVGKIKADNLTADRTLQIPDKDGIIALLSDITGTANFIEDIIAGDNITIDKTDPKNPVISGNAGGGGGGTWGSITGTLSDQTDLNAALTTLQSNIDNEAGTRVSISGLLANLNTTDKATMVNAINEVLAKVSANYITQNQKINSLAINLAQTII